jgi:hypothetical protein
VVDIQGGGGIWAGGTLIVDHSTFTGNSARFNGGGILGGDGSTVSITNSTITENSATAGGGVWLADGGVISHSTIVNNSADLLGGGIFVRGGSLQLNHSIVGLNSAPTGRELTGLIGANIAPTFSLISWNADSGLVEAPVGAPDANGNLVGGPAHGYINPSIAPLADNGGPTLTHAILPHSPAINAGDPAAVSGVDGVPYWDQRGFPFMRVSGGRIDMGAFELQPPPEFVPGDYNRDYIVDMADYVVFRMQMGMNVEPGSGADGNGDGIVNQADYAVWMANLSRTSEAGSHPEGSRLGAGSGEPKAASQDLAAGSAPQQAPILDGSGLVFDTLRTRSASQSTKSPQHPRIASTSDAERADRALTAWAAALATDDEPANSSGDALADDDDQPATSTTALDRVFATLDALRLM